MTDRLHSTRQSKKMQRHKKGNVTSRGTRPSRNCKRQCVWITLSERNVGTEEDKPRITKGFVKQVINFELYLKDPKYRSQSYQVFTFRNSLQPLYGELITVRKLQ